jgi:hypothetical protein
MSGNKFVRSNQKQVAAPPSHIQEVVQRGMVPRSIAEEIDPLLSRVWRLIFGLIDVVGV